MKKSPWFLRNDPPVRHGLYECVVRVAGMRVLVNWGLLKWDGKGFLVPVPMRVHQWRGLKNKPSNVELTGSR